MPLLSTAVYVLAPERSEAIESLSSKLTETDEPARQAAPRTAGIDTSAILTPLPRSPVRLGRDAFTTLFTLTEKQPWLKEKQVSLSELIDDCEEHDQQLLVCRLLQRFTFLDGADFYASIQAIVEYIQGHLGLSASTCTISASDNGKFADSSQLVVYSLKAAKWNSLDWNTTSFVSSLTSLVENASKGNIVVVDEFIGTGETAEKKVKWIKERLVDKGASPKIYFAVVAGMASGIDRLSTHVDGVFAAHTLRKGITDLGPAADAEIDISTMKKLEGILSSEGRRGKLKKHSLGYKGSESLYARANGNTPNNVFPIFWWEAKKDGSPQSTLLSCI